MGTAIKVNRGGGGTTQIENAFTEEFYAASETIDPNTFVEFSGNISYEDLVNVIEPGQYTQNMIIKKITNTKFIYAYTYSLDVRLGIIDYTNGVFSKEIETAINPASGMAGSSYWLSLEVVSDTQFLIANSTYASDYNYHQLCSISYNYSTKTFTVGTLLNVASGNLQEVSTDTYNWLIPLTTNKYALLYPKKVLNNTSYVPVLWYIIITTGVDSSTEKFVFSVGSETRLYSNNEYISPASFYSSGPFPCLRLSETKLLFIVQNSSNGYDYLFVGFNGSTTLTTLSKMNLLSMSEFARFSYGYLSSELLDDSTFVVSYLLCNTAGTSSTSTFKQIVLERYKVDLENNSCKRLERVLLNESAVSLSTSNYKFCKVVNMTKFKNYLFILYITNVSAAVTSKYIHILAIDLFTLNRATDDIVLPGASYGSWNLPIIGVSDKILLFLSTDESTYPQPGQPVKSRAITLSDLKVKKSERYISGITQERATTTKKGKVALLNK